MSRLDMLRPSGFTFDVATTLPDREGYNPTDHVVSNQIHFPDTRGICLAADWAVLGHCNHLGSQANLMLERNNSGNPQPKN
jgi:hypothetical protein